MIKGFKVSGRVQGVFFRDTTKRKAEELGLTGYAKNMPDGSVEVVAKGDEESLTELKDFLMQGSSMARVSDVQEFDVDNQDFQGFGTY